MSVILVLFLACGKGTNYDALYVSVKSAGTWKKADVRTLAVSFLRKNGKKVEIQPKTVSGLRFATPKGLGDKPWVLKVELQQKTAGKAWVRVEALDDSDSMLAAGVREFELKNSGVTVVLRGKSDCDRDGDGVVADRPECKTQPDEPVDCDDNNPDVSPFVYVDECTNCYSKNIPGSVKDANCSGTTINCKDQDQDGWPDCIPAVCMPGGGQENTVTCMNLAKFRDCAPSDKAIHPGATEWCNDKDDNCNGQTDEPGPNTITENGKAKGEICGLGICAGGTVKCDAKTRKAVCSTAYKAKDQEICDNGLDDNCNGQTDSAAEGCGGTTSHDVDGDGVPNEFEEGHCGKCGKYAEYHSEVFPDYDVTDNNGDIKQKIRHKMPEPCCPLSLQNQNRGENDVPCQCDWNCDGKVHWCAEDDQDGDGYPAGPDTDCNDNDPTIHQGAPEKCGDGVDQDCRGGDLPCKGIVDKDHDGYAPPADCDDNDPNIHPNAKEQCDGKDDNCNGIVDDGNPGGGTACHPWGKVTYEKDVCVPGTLVCTHEAGSEPKLECLDATGPKTEKCDGLDNDCDGKVDEDFKYEPDTGESCHGEDCQGIAVGQSCSGLGVCSNFTGKVECLDKDTVVCSVGENGSEYKGGPEKTTDTLYCNDKDDDCDGQTDEDFNLNTDVYNCGKCHIHCVNDHGTTSCINKVCVPICSTGYGDCDGDPVNGCETDLATVNQCGTCTQDNDCPPDFFCDGQHCMKKYLPPHECARNEECHSGICTDEGFCCGTPCNGPCQSCASGSCKHQQDRSIPEKQDACNGFLCGPDGQCLIGCSGDSDCMEDHFCDTDENSPTKQTCQPDMALGENCARLNNDSKACASGLCVDGVCCENKCQDTCKACNIAGNLGHCATVQNAEDPGTCDDTRQCNANGDCKLKNLQPCNSDGQCLSGHCKADHDGTGQWCAGADECVHDAKIYKDGDFSSACMDNGSRAKCVNGQWKSASCGTDTVCIDHYCNKGKCKVNYADHRTQCNSTPKCSSTENGIGYGSGGDYICKGFCDGAGKCDWAGACTDCNTSGNTAGNRGDGWYNYGDKYNDGCNHLNDGTAEYRDYTCSNAKCTYSVTGHKSCDAKDGWYGGGNTPGCGPETYKGIQRDYYVDSDGRCEYTTKNCGTRSCDAQDKCSAVCSDMTHVAAYKDYYVQQDSNTCTYKYGDIVKDCLKVESTETDGGPDDYTTPGAVTDYTQCQNGACVGTQYLDSCSGNQLTEYGADGSGVTSNTIDCDAELGHDLCVGNSIYHQSYSCTSQNGMGYCKKGSSQFKKSCGTNQCSGSCPGCKYIENGCSNAQCTTQSFDPDSGRTYCTGCGQHWNIGGDVSPTKCCGDDAGEYYATCTDQSANGDCGTDTEACCTSGTDCVDHTGACRASGHCYVFGTAGKKSYCDSYGIWQDPDKDSSYCSACDFNWINSANKCCGDDGDQDIFSAFGIDFACCYKGNMMTSGQVIDSILCYNGQLYNCNKNIPVSNQITTETTCQQIGNLYCTDNDTWADKKSDNCRCTADSECHTNHCAQDYDGTGAWCEPAGQCAHDTQTYNSGDNAPDCKDSSTARVCDSSGQWTTQDCGASACDSQIYHLRGCSSGGLNIGKCYDTPVDPDTNSVACQACSDHWLNFSNGANSKCCGDDGSSDSFDNPGTGFPCCYQGSMLDSGSTSGAILCYNGKLYDCNGSDFTSKTTCDKVGSLYCTSPNTWSNTNTGCACNLDADCSSNHCAQDYDQNGGAWCEPADECAHDTQAYNSGDNAPDCKDSYNAWKCNNGTWASESCGTDVCQDGSCT